MQLVLKHRVQCLQWYIALVVSFASYPCNEHKTHVGRPKCESHTSIVRHVTCVRGRGGGGGGGGGGASSIFRRQSVWLKLLHSIHIKAKSENHIHNMTTIFCLYDCISFNDLP